MPGYDLANAVLRDPGFRVTDAAELDVPQPGWRDHPALDASNLLMLNGDAGGPRRREGIVLRGFEQLPVTLG